jgi:hypothetical protein
MRAVPSLSFNGVVVNYAGAAGNVAAVGNIFVSKAINGLYLQLDHNAVATAGQGGACRVTDGAGNFFNMNSEL